MTDLLNFICFISSKSLQRLPRYLGMQVCLSQLLTTKFSSFSDQLSQNWFCWFHSLLLTEVRRYRLKCLNIVQWEKAVSLAIFFFFPYLTGWVLNNALFRTVYQHGLWMTIMLTHTWSRLFSLFSHSMVSILCGFFPVKFKAVLWKKSRWSYIKQTK